MMHRSDPAPGRYQGRRWALAIFSSRETAHQLYESVRAAANADRAGATLTIDLLVNGNAALAEEMHDWLTTHAALNGGATVRLWRVPPPDKAHAWNRYLHEVMPLADLAFCIDGYVKIDHDALLNIADALERRPDALAATSVPWTGRSAEAQRRQLFAEGGFHGNLYALTGRTVTRLREQRFRLPTGIYRNDSALGAALAFNLDPAHNAWSWDRIVVVPDARYRTPVASPLKASDLKTVIQRHLRQARGQLETLALRGHLALAQRPPTAWPATARGLVLQWADEHPAEARSLIWTDPLAWAALLRLRRSGEESSPSGRIECIARFANGRAAHVETVFVNVAKENRAALEV